MKENVVRVSRLAKNVFSESELDESHQALSAESHVLFIVQYVQAQRRRQLSRKTSRIVRILDVLLDGDKKTSASSLGGHQ